MDTPNSIKLRGIRVHNLKNIDVKIPLHRLTVVTGVSGAGKSSLVFDTLYAEAQRRYLQTFSTWTRQFLERFDKPDADEISDLPPAIAIRAARVGVGPRATVGSLTDIGTDLRLLFARAGVIVCPDCAQSVKSHGPREVFAALTALPTGIRCTLAFSQTLREDTDQAAWLAAFLEEGYVRIQIGKHLYRLGEQAIPALAPSESIWVLLDRIEIGKTPSERISESIEHAFRRGEGRVGVFTDGQEAVFDQRHVCPRCERVFAAPQPGLFDYDDPLGACAACKGTGTVKVTACAACQERRFNSNSLAVYLGERTIADCCEQSLAELLAFTQRLTLSTESTRLELVKERLRLLASLDLGHLTLSLPASQLSDGETKRIALAAALASNLVNVLYLIDEPTTGLHPRHSDKLVAALTQLRERGNTIVVIENDRQVIAAADHVIDIGPDAGEDGGRVTYQGTPAGLASAPESPTSDVWCGRSVIETPRHRRKPTGFLKLSGIGDPIDFPLGVLCVVTGVGATRLIGETLYPLLVQSKKTPTVASAARLSGANRISDVVLLDQHSLSKSSRSNPATYLKIFDEIRALFAEAVDARIRNFGAGHFSFNQPGGRCETCAGQGTLTIDMQFLADVVSTCPDCRGRRFRDEILDIKVRSLSIAEVLDLTIREAFRFFRAQPTIEKKLKWLLDVGLEYLRLGQPVETLSGSECQRLKLAGHLASNRKTGVLFLLTEPSGGLHPADVANLLECFDRLLDGGHSLIVIESDLDMIRCADCVIDFDSTNTTQAQA